MQKQMKDKLQMKRDMYYVEIRKERNKFILLKMRQSLIQHARLQSQNNYENPLQQLETIQNQLKLAFIKYQFSLVYQYLVKIRIYYSNPQTTPLLNKTEIYQLLLQIINKVRSDFTIPHSSDILKYITEFLAIVIPQVQMTNQEIQRLKVIQFFEDCQESKQVYIIKLIIYFYTNMMNSEDSKRFSRLSNKIKFVIHLLTKGQINQDSIIEQVMSFIVVYSKKSLILEQNCIQKQIRELLINVSYRILTEYCYFLYEKKKSSDGQIISDAISVLLILTCNPKYEKYENYLLKYQLNPFIELLLVKKIPSSTKKQIYKILGHIIYISDILAIHLLKKTTFFKIILDQSAIFKLEIFTILANLATIQQLHENLAVGLNKICFLFLSELQYENKKQLLRFFENWFQFKNRNSKVNYQGVLQFLSQNQQADERLINRQSKFWYKLVENGYRNKIPNHIKNYDCEQRDIINSILSSSK